MSMYLKGRGRILFVRATTIFLPRDFAKGKLSELAESAEQRHYEQTLMRVERTRCQLTIITPASANTQAEEELSRNNELPFARDSAARS
jgi:hypothetical protein